MNMRPISGRAWAYAGAFLGGAVSIAANVAHSYVPPDKAPDEWSPQTGAVIGAIFWPVALFVAVEIFAKVEWPDGNRWVVLRFLGLLPVAAVAAVVSYRHMSGLLAFYGEDRLTSTIGPLAVDGLMIMATGALIALGPRVQAAAVAAPAAADASAPEAPAAVEAPDLDAEWAALEAASVPARPRPPRSAQKRTGAARGSAPKKRSVTDAEAVEQLVEQHPDSNPSKRKTAALLGVHFNRVSSIHALADEKRSASRYLEPATN